MKWTGRAGSTARRDRAFVTAGAPRAAILAAGLLALGASGASGQLAWETPLLVHPHAPHGWSVLLADSHPGDNVGVIGMWRTAAAPVGFGVRAGLGEAADGDLALFGGVDASGTVLERSDEVPLDVVWVLGGGLSIADDLLVSFPAALVAGWVLRADDVTFLPYVGPRVVLDAWIGDTGRGEGSDDLGLDVVVDLGMDIRLPAGWVIRFGAAVGDRDAVAIGVALPAVGRR